MEVARLIRFLDSTILFSLTTKFEKNLKNEIWLCHKNMNLSMDEILNMSVADRKTYISIHNRLVEKEKEQLKMKRR